MLMLLGLFMLALEFEPMSQHLSHRCGENFGDESANLSKECLREFCDLHNDPTQYTRAYIFFFQKQQKQDLKQQGIEIKLYKGNTERKEMI